MRYDCSQAYNGLFSIIGPDGRFCLLNTSQEPVGQGLCTSSDGTGVNKIGRNPKSRYHEAWAIQGKGNCADQICVNDLYH